ncbi:hypothetical protein [uncultured Photobacterium sp.]|uniref:hypothetical protein n=1 Tax=uncultured Photobacterium sp. TaxID=173973 RepID=UPI00260CFB3B|nr:hypothetical protein [uncultured Photobacterium sp.]
MLTFNKDYVFSNQPDNEITEDTQSPTNTTPEQETKRRALLVAVQKTGGLDVAECRQH